jgi:peptidoglycan glycosyltransferase
MLSDRVKKILSSRKNLSILVLFLIAATSSALMISFSPTVPVFSKIDFRKKLNESFRRGKLPEKIYLDKRIINLKYTFDEKLTGYINKLLRYYKSDHSAVIVIDNNTGKIKAAVGYTREGRKVNFLLPFTSTHPSASLFKIITAAELIQNTEVDIDSKFLYRGKSTTLYKYQLNDKRNKWTRSQTFRKAFASSNNVIFGKAAINHLTGVNIFKMANSFGFNKDLMNEISLSKSSFIMPDSQYNLAELASGFNKETTISPIHAAMLASVIANDGILKSPTLIEKIKVENENEVGLNFDQSETRVISNETSKKLKNLMTLTIKRGTARSAFKKISRGARKNLVIGGKTGTITGGLPYGKRDWFTAFVIPKDGGIEDKGISIAVMNINIKHWYVKSAVLAKKVIEYYYKNNMRERKSSLTAYNDRL